MILKDENVIGKKFNHLTIVKKGEPYISPSGHRGSQWWCECDCGNPKLVLVRYTNLTSNNTKSCGCQNIQSSKQNLKKAIEKCKINLTGVRRGKLVGIEPTDKRIRNSVVWKCQCDCGTIKYLPANEFNAGKYYSCGCMTESKGIYNIKKILNENNIPYETEKTFSTCKFPDTNALARFDFFINNKFLLEYDGVQHYEDRDLNYFRDNLEKRQNHDEFKNQWCKENNIPLVRIPYAELDNLSLELIMGDKYLI